MPEIKQEENIQNKKQQGKRPAASLFGLGNLLQTNPGDLLFENITRIFAFIVLSIVFLMA